MRAARLKGRCPTELLLSALGTEETLILRAIVTLSCTQLSYVWLSAVPRDSTEDTVCSEAPSSGCYIQTLPLPQRSCLDRKAVSRNSSLSLFPGPAMITAPHWPTWRMLSL